MHAKQHIGCAGSVNSKTVVCTVAPASKKPPTIVIQEPPAGPSEASCPKIGNIVVLSA